MKLIAVLFLLIPVVAQASCFDDAAKRYDVESALLKAIAWQESRGHANAVGPQLSNGHVAVGVMQINTNHLDELAPYGIQRKQLFNGCTSVNVGAWILAKCIKDVGRTWNAVGCYYAGAKSKNFTAKKQYVSSVKKHYRGYKQQESQKHPVEEVKLPTGNTLLSEASSHQIEVWQ